MLLSLFYLMVRRLVGNGTRSDDGRDIEILVLRHQLKVLRRQVKRPRLRRLDRTLLAAASRAMPRRLWSSLVVKPETLLRWHRELVRGKWTFRKKRSTGRPRLDPEIVASILRLARENPRWGYQRIRGELMKLGTRVSGTTIRAVLLGHGLSPAPRRAGPTWTEFLSSQAQGILACDFFTVETLTLKTLYVLFFIELSTRKVHVMGATARPDSAWVTEQARNLAIEGHLEDARFLLHDWDAKFSGPFDEVFRTEEVRVLIYRRRHLERVLRAYVDHYMEERPHRGLDLATPRGVSAPEARDPERKKRIERRDVLGGLIHEYRWAA
jgi:hypothetical protein